MEFQPVYLIIGVVVTVVAIIFKLFPPRKISLWRGYRSQTSVASQETWDAAQKYASKLMLIEGIILMILGVAFGMMSVQMGNKVRNIILISFVAIVIPIAFILLIVATEVYLNKNFAKKKED
jgi:uncharacterized membrane protein